MKTRLVNKYPTYTRPVRNGTNVQNLLFIFDQLTGKIENMKIGILNEGFGLKNSEPDVDKMVKEAAGQLGSQCGAVVEEVSIPMHLDGN